MEQLSPRPPPGPRAIFILLDGTPSVSSSSQGGILQVRLLAAPSSPAGLSLCKACRNVSERQESNRPLRQTPHSLPPRPQAGGPDTWCIAPPARRAGQSLPNSGRERAALAVARGRGRLNLLQPSFSMIRSIAEDDAARNCLRETVAGSCAQRRLSRVKYDPARPSRTT